MSKPILNDLPDVNRRVVHWTYSKEELLPREPDKELGWQYIAGFFDGEGSINSMPRNDSWQIVVQLCQTSGEHHVIGKISEFLGRMGITNSVELRSETDRRKPLYTLKIHKFESAYTFLVHVSPYLIVKKGRCDEAIRVFEKRFSEEIELRGRLRLAALEYCAGSYIHEVATKFGLTRGRVRGWMRKNKISLRSPHRFT